MSTRTISDGLIEKVTLYSSSYWLFRRDVLPFLVYYSVFFGLALSSNMSHKYYGLIALPIGLVAHLLLFLLSQWSVNIKCMLGNQKTSDYAATNVLHINAASNAGKDKLLRLDRTKRDMKSTKVSILDKSYQLYTDSFQFQKVTYNYDTNTNNFIRLDYPTVGTIRGYLDWLGHQTMEDVIVSLHKWGRNEFDIPIPNFLDLYLDHLIAPFFVFQVLCLFLWSLDDYWYYSAFTLLMLMFFEGMMCKQRQASLTMLRNMRRPPMHIFVFRGKQWTLITSDLLVPGDIISLNSNEIHFQRKDLIKASSEKKEVQVPCDALLIRGSVVVNEAMLTGESVPQIKETLDNAENKENGRVDLGPDSTIDATWRRHLVFSGTSLLLHNEVTAAEIKSSDGKLVHQIPSAPDMGAVAVVVRTGFGTCQGGLMRKILFATERVNGSNTMETFYFIGVLVIFAIFAAGSVLTGGLQDPNRNKFRLVLHCIMIITSVVPPELPMELSLAVTNSLSALAKSLVYCTEPFRIAFAGKLDVLCFDKTGTLTKDQMILRGIVAAQEIAIFSAGSSSRLDSTSASQPTGNDDLMLGQLSPDLSEVEVFDASMSFDIVSVIMGACHDLMPQPSSLFGGEATDSIVGDPLEQVTMRASGFTFDQFRSDAAGNKVSGIFLTNHARDLKISVKHKYPFSSALKRMSVVCEVDKHADDSKPIVSATKTSSTDSSSSVSGRANFVLTKGAPEILEGLLSSVPSFYKATYRYHMSRGKRVLAIACKRLSPKLLTAKDIRDKSRTDMESNLQFVGFLVYDCDMKVDSKSVIRELRSSNLKVVMITGDSVYTAADVARKLGMINTTSNESGETASMVLVSKKPTVFTSKTVIESFEDTLVWRRLADTDTDEVLPLPNDIKFDSANLKDLTTKYSLCLTGPLLVSAEQSNVNYLNFLKQICPHITVFARVSPVQKESIVQALNGSGLYTLMCGDGTNDVGALKAAHVGISIVNDPEFEKRIETARDPTTPSEVVKSGSKKPKGTSAKDRMARAMKELQEQEADPTIVKLGDASIASPFTARRTSIDSVLTVIRQGRCTLVTTFQVYKILALNCLVTAYMMSALYMRGLKQGDTQMTASGLIIAGLFFFLSQAKPLQRISPTKPPSSVFAYAVGLSIFGQFVVHLSSLIAVLYLCEQYIKEDDFSLSPDGKFQPNVVNSAVYLLSALMQVNNFVVNYRGHPFTQSITENVTLWRSIQAIYAILLIVAGGQFEPLNDLLQMAPFPSSEFQATLIGILVFNFAAAYGIEKLCQRLE